jgi:uroporphyrinogen decarboxylase
MNSRERFLTAIQGNIPDRVPLFEFYWNPALIKSVLGQPMSPHHNADDEVKMSLAMEIDMVYTAPYGFSSFTNIQIHGTEYRDEWGTLWGTDKTSWPGGWPKTHVINSPEDWEKLPIPDPTLPKRMDQPKRTIELANGKLAVLGGVRGPFSALWMLSGITNISRWIYENPGFLHEILHEMGKWNTLIGLQLIETGVDAVIIHDDWGMNTATFLSPDHWNEFIKPYVVEQIETFANTNTPVILHSDGNINALMDEITQLPINALNPLQRSAGMNLAAIKEKYGDRICIIGNLSTTETLPDGSPDDVEREVLGCLRDAAPGGGYVLAPDHSYHSAIPVENIHRALDTCKKYGIYPIDMEKIQKRLEELDEKISA